MSATTAIINTEKLLQQLENKNFHEFIKTFYDVYYAAQGEENSTAIKSVQVLLEKFRQLIAEEANEILKISMTTQTLDYNTSCIKIARQHPLILYYTFCHNALEKCFKLKGQEKLDPKNLFEGAIYIYSGEQSLTMNFCFAIFPELKYEPYLLLTLLENNSGCFRSVYSYFKKNNVSIPYELERKLIHSLLEYSKINYQDLLNNNTFTENLYFLLSEGISLQGKGESWFKVLSWDDITENQIFLFDHMEKEKTEILKYFSEKYPNLVYTHLLKGNFFIAEQLIHYGLQAPSFEVSNFISDAILLGLKTSQEIKKYHAILLLANYLGFFPRKDIPLLTQLLGSKQNEILQKYAESVIPNLVKLYLSIHDAEITSKKENYKRIHSLMLIVEKDYAIALSTLYNLTLLDSRETIKCFRGITIPKAKLNKSLVEHWLGYGHKASFYSFMQHGYNHFVYDDLEQGKSMSWYYSSNTTRIGISINTFYLTRENDVNTHESYLLKLSYTTAHPLFFGNATLNSEGLPSEFEMPRCYPENVEAIYYYDSKRSLFSDIHHPGLQDNIAQFNSAIESSKKQLLEDLKPHKNQLSKSNQAYLKEYNPWKMLTTFKENYNYFSFYSKRMRFIRSFMLNFNQLNSNSIQLAMSYLDNESAIEQKKATETLSFTLTEIASVSHTIHSEVAKRIKGSVLSGNQIIDLICNHYSAIQQLFLSGAQVWEGYTVEEHTKLVFEKLEEHRKLPQYLRTINSVRSTIPNINVLFPLLIALHDIGKSIGHKDDQHHHTMIIIEKILKLLNFSLQDIAFANILINHDLIGQYLIHHEQLLYRSSEDLKSQDDFLEKIISKLQINCRKIPGLKFKDFCYLQFLFYLSDAGSYPSLYRDIMQPIPNLPFSYIPNNDHFLKLSNRCQWNLPLYQSLQQSLPLLSEAISSQENHPFEVILEYCGNDEENNLMSNPRI